MKKLLIVLGLLLAAFGVVEVLMWWHNRPR